MSIPLKVLIVEDSEEDTMLILHEFRKYGYMPDYIQVMDAESLASSIDEGGWDLILSDYSMPSFDGMKALEIVRKFDGEIPFLVVSGLLDKETTVNLLNAGANDCLEKEKMHQLVPLARKAIRDAKLRTDHNNLF